MPEPKLKLVEGGAKASVDLTAVFNALDVAVLGLNAEGSILNANSAAEQLVGRSLESMRGEALSRVAPELSDLESISLRASTKDIVITEHGIGVFNPRTGHGIYMDVAASPIPESGGWVALRIIETTVTQQMDRRLGYLGAARSVSGMASVLAHEVKNPLSGIRGASQLLDQHVSDADRQLTDLIRDEVDRICALVDRMGQFSGNAVLHPVALNIHKVLDRVHNVAMNGFAANISFVTDYDPSLPLVSGERDLLIQVFLNLIKNAAEAVPVKGGRITLRTAYKPGVRLLTSPGKEGEDAPRNLPLVVEITDNGPGIEPELRDHLFDPFVTSKPNGSGLGLALTAKIIHDHGGMIDFESIPGQTTFRVLLPIHTGTTVDTPMDTPVDTNEEML
ncbi:MAG: PAS domain-containing protein [Rhodospirillales bacterium]|nr:PAS domain-containing protein [Rhodospirillales bacterium]